MIGNQRIVEMPLWTLVPHDANMRRLYPVGPMAELTTQMLARGYDPDKPMLVQPLPKKGRQKQKYCIVRGHRRRMARVFSLFLLQQDGEKVWSIEDVLAAWETAVVPTAGDVPAVIEELLKKSFGKATVPVVIFQGDYKESLAALWSDNFGDDKPDLMGSAHSFLAGHKAGYTIPEIAGQVGQSTGYVTNLISLAGLDERLAKRIAQGQLGLSLASALMALNEEKRSGAISFILSNDSSMLTVTRLVAAIKRTKNWSGFQIPLTVSMQKQRNVARAMVELWNQRVDTNPDSAWESVFAYFYGADADYVEPHTSIKHLVGWMIAFGVIATSESSAALLKIGHFLPVEQVSCETCPVWQLPEPILTVDLNSPLLGCRHPQLRGKIKNCLHGLSPSDPFHVCVPQTWAELPGVTGGDTTPRPYVDSYENLVLAYSARAALEKSRRQEEERVLAKRKELTSETADRGSGPAPKAGDDEPPKPDGPRPIDIMRGKISAYMALHELMDGRNHLMATPCSKCVNRLEISPTSDLTVPACATASRLSSVKFEKIVPGDGANFPDIPICRQYKPSVALSEIVPAYPGDVTIDRNMMLSHIRRFAKSSTGGRMLFEYVIGSAESGKSRQGWLESVLDDEQGNLSDEQVMTLFLLAVNEHQRVDRWANDGQFFIPEGANNLTRWQRAKHQDWSFDEV